MKRKGLNLVEILFVMLLFSLLISMLFQILLTGRGTWDIGTAGQEVEYQALLGLDRMSSELYESNPNKINPVPPFNNISNITFQLPVGYDEIGNLKWGADSTENHYIQYKIDNRQLLRERLNESKVAINQKVWANHAQELKFTLPEDSNELTISLKTQKTTPQNRTLYQTMSSKVTFRN